MPTKDLKSPAGLEQIVALVRRSDTVAIKSEGTRVLVNVIKSLWSVSDTSLDAEQKKSQQEAITAVLVPASAEVLSSLVGRSMKYPLLVNEGVVALTLLSTHKDGGEWLTPESFPIFLSDLTCSHLGKPAPIVLAAILAPLPAEVTPNSASSGPLSASASTSSDVDSPLGTSPPTRSRLSTPRRAIDRLVAVLKNTPSSDTNSVNNRPNVVNFPIEVRANVCALLGQVGRQASGGQLETLKETTKNILEELSKSAGQGRDGLLGTASKKVLDGWATSETK